MPLSVSQRRAFAGRGYLQVGRVSTVGQVAGLRQEALRLLGADGTTPRAIPDDHLMVSSHGHVRVAMHLCHLSDLFRDHAVHSPAAVLVKELWSEPVAVLTSLLFNKPAWVGLALNLHQDLPYYPYLGDEDLVTCWMALDEASLDNGCVEYLPGSHRSRIEHRSTGAQQALDIDPGLVDTAGTVAVPLAPGEAVLHHGLTVHRSAANRSPRPRLGLATLYVRGGVRVSLEDFPYPPLAPEAVRTRQSR